MKKVLFLLSIWLTASLSLWASVGKIVDHRGEVTVERSGTNYPATRNFALEEHDRIVTGPNGWSRIRLDDRTQIVVGKNARFQLQAYRYDRTPRSKIALGFSQGVFRAITGAVGKVARKNFKVRTPTATIGIRGTEFYVEVRPDREQVLCTRGAITFTLPSQRYLVRAGHYLVEERTGTTPVIREGRIPSSELKRLKRLLRIPVKETLVARSKGGVLRQRADTIPPQTPPSRIRTSTRQKPTRDDPLRHPVRGHDTMTPRPIHPNPTDLRPFDPGKLDPGRLDPGRNDPIRHPIGLQETIPKPDRADPHPFDPGSIIQHPCDTPSPIQ